MDARATDRRVVFVTRIGAPWVLWVSALAIVIGALIGPGDGAWAPALFIAPLVFAFLSMRLRIGARGVEVSFGPWNWPTKRIPLERITGARVETVDPVRFGGWGYKRRPGVRAIVVKGGPALWVEVDGNDLVVTMDRPDDAVAAINALVRARGTSPSQAS